MHPGRCARCRFLRVIESKRGSRFFLCKRAATDSRLRKYPPIPVFSCVGFEDAEPDPAADGERAEPSGDAGPSRGV